MRRCIERKRDGEELAGDDWRAIVTGLMQSHVDDAQMASLLMACVWRGMSFAEAFALTDAMVSSGETLTFPVSAGLIVDKHSSGGVGDIVSLVAVPLAAACGAKVAKLSGRALGHTGGTIDKLETIPGFETGLSTEAFLRQVQDIGCAIAAQTRALVPADRRIYHLRDRTATVPAMGLMAASIVSKKIACGANAIVFDVKTGAASFVSDPDRARELAGWLVEICLRFGRKATAFVTDMNQPLGATIGTGIEIVEARELLRELPAGRAGDLIVRIVSEMLEASGIDDGDRRAREAIADGSGYAKFVEMIEAQHGSRSGFEAMQLDPQPLAIEAANAGFVQSIDVVSLGNLGRDLSERDPMGGLRVEVHIGDRVERGQLLARAYGQDKTSARSCAGAFRLGNDPVEPPPLIYDVIRPS